MMIPKIPLVHHVLIQGISCGGHIGKP